MQEKSKKQKRKPTLIDGQKIVRAEKMEIIFYIN